VNCRLSLMCSDCIFTCMLVACTPSSRRTIQTATCRLYCRPWLAMPDDTRHGQSLWLSTTGSPGRHLASLHPPCCVHVTYYHIATMTIYGFTGLGSEGGTDAQDSMLPPTALLAKHYGRAAGAMQRAPASVVTAGNAASSRCVSSCLLLLDIHVPAGYTACDHRAQMSRV
jgi:hypothetical protein